jgi:hypothetical protein
LELPVAGLINQAIQSARIPNLVAWNGVIVLKKCARRAPWSAAASCRLGLFAGYSFIFEGASKLAHSKGFGFEKNMRH